MRRRVLVKSTVLLRSVNIWLMYTNYQQLQRHHSVQGKRTENQKRMIILIMTIVTNIEISFAETLNVLQH